jgi:hypothetical protein
MKTNMIWGRHIHIRIPYQVLFDVSIVEDGGAVSNTAHVRQQQVIALKD